MPVRNYARYHVHLAVYPLPHRSGAHRQGTRTSRSQILEAWPISSCSFSTYTFYLVQVCHHVPDSIPRFTLLLVVFDDRNHKLSSKKKKQIDVNSTQEGIGHCHHGNPTRLQQPIGASITILNEGRYPKRVSLVFEHSV
jgi:hypothetical protein